MDDWECERDFRNPNQWGKPCLEGIPDDHIWWDNELGVRIKNNNYLSSDSDLD